MRRIKKPTLPVEEAISRHKVRIKNKFSSEYKFDFTDSLIDEYIKELKTRERFYLDNLTTLSKISNSFSTNVLNTREKHQELYGLCYYSDSKNRSTLFEPIINNKRRCLFCDTRVSKKNLHLDHFLPKTAYPDLSAIPVNLIPTCDSCNSNKHDKMIPEGRNILLPYNYDYDLKKFIKIVSIKNSDTSLKYKNEFQVTIKDYSGTLEKLYTHDEYLDIKEHLTLYRVNKTLTNSCIPFYRTTFLNAIKNEALNFPEKNLVNHRSLKAILKSLSRGSRTDYIDYTFYQTELSSAILNGNLNEVDNLMHDLFIN